MVPPSSRRSHEPTQAPTRSTFFSERTIARSPNRWLAAIFASGDNGQATIRTIKHDGLERMAQLDQTSVQYYQFLPLYDVIHLGNVLRKGYAPRRERQPGRSSTAAS